jgi:two-component system chemotaxis response regulator CheB
MNAIIVIAGSAGSHVPLTVLVDAMPSFGFAAVFIVTHVGANPSILPGLITSRNGMPASFATDLMAIKPGRIYVAPPDRHMTLRRGYIRLDNGPKAHRTRPAADPLFVSAASAYGPSVVGIVLSGGGSDGALGLRAIKEHGGTALVQSPDEAINPSMPLAALLASHPDAALDINRLAERLKAVFRVR